MAQKGKRKLLKVIITSTNPTAEPFGFLLYIFYYYRHQNAHRFKAKGESVNYLLFIYGIINTTNKKAGLST